MLKPDHFGGPDARRLQPSVSRPRQLGGRIDDARPATGALHWLLPPRVPDRWRRSPRLHFFSSLAFASALRACVRLRACPVDQKPESIHEYEHTSTVALRRCQRAVALCRRDGAIGGGAAL